MTIANQANRITYVKAESTKFGGPDWGLSRPELHPKLDMVYVIPGTRVWFLVIISPSGTMRFKYDLQIIVGRHHWVIGLGRKNTVEPCDYPKSKGWRCKRERGHESPCAAVPTGFWYRLLWYIRLKT